MKCISWNVNGLRACVGKGFEEVFRNLDADFFCLQETKLQPGQISLETPGYSQFWNSAEKKGYSGTAIFAKKPPLSVTYGIGIPATLNMALPSLLISALNGILAAYSGAYVLVLGVYYKLQTFIYLPSNGIIQGIRPLIGYNYGAGERNRVEQIYRLTLELTAGIMAIGTALCWLIPGGLIGLFTENPETVTIGITALHIISLGFILSAVSVTSSGALEALGQGMASLVISVMRYVAVIIPAAFGLSSLIGVTGVWWAFVCTESVTAVVAYVLYHRVWKRA